MRGNVLVQNLLEMSTRECHPPLPQDKGQPHKTEKITLLKAQHIDHWPTPWLLVMLHVLIKKKQMTIDSKFQCSKWKLGLCVDQCFCIYHAKVNLNMFQLDDRLLPWKATVMLGFKHVSCACGRSCAGVWVRSGRYLWSTELSYRVVAQVVFFHYKMAAQYRTYVLACCILRQGYQSYIKFPTNFSLTCWGPFSEGCDYTHFSSHFVRFQGMPVEYCITCGLRPTGVHAAAAILS